MSRSNRIPLANAVSLIAWGREFSQEDFSQAKAVEANQSLLDQGESDAGIVDVISEAIKLGERVRDNIEALGVTYPSDEADEQLATAFAPILEAVINGDINAFGRTGPTADSNDIIEREQIRREWFMDSAPVADVLVDWLRGDKSPSRYIDVELKRDGIVALANRLFQKNLEELEGGEKVSVGQLCNVEMDHLLSSGQASSQRDAGSQIDKKKGLKPGSAERMARDFRSKRVK